MKTYTAAELKPYLTAATTYIRLLAASDKFIATAIAATRAVLAGAGAVELATRLKGLPAAKRAKIGLARLRVAAVRPERIVSIVLAITALAHESGHRTKEFRTVQVCKAICRLASGTGWASSSKRVYPRMSGRVLRLMGRMLEEPSQWATTEKHIAGVLVHKQLYGRRPRGIISHHR